MVKIAVRLDDITPDMDWEKFLAFKEILDAYSIKPLIGIVPFNQDNHLKGSQKGAPEDFWNYIRQLQADGWCVALHGYNHLYTSDKGGMFPLNQFSEFAGVSYETQKKYLAEGKEELKAHGIETDIFMAPAHSYDRNTLKALKEVGFTALTDGFGQAPYIRDGLKFYPISYLLKHTLRQKEGFSTLVVHTGTIEDFKAYHAYFGSSRVEWIDYSVYLNQNAKRQSVPECIAEYVMAYGKGLIGRLRQKP